MDYQAILINIIFLPLIGAFLLPFFGRVASWGRNIFAFFLVLNSFLFSLKFIPFILSGKTLFLSKHLAMGFNLCFVVDGLAVFMACVSSLISAVIILYSFGYISHYENQNEYYTMVVLFLAAMMGLVYAGNLILLYIFWEITAITSWRLIGFFRSEKDVLRADKSFLVTVFGALAMLIGFIMIYQQTGSFDLPAIKSALKVSPISNMAVFLILVGIFSKSATLPFHTWLPDAGVAPSPVTALLHAAVLVKIGVYVFARLFLATFTPAQIWHTVVPVVAALSALISAGAALRETDLKRIIAYSTISQIGFIFLGLSTGNMLGVTGGLLYILMHGLAKGGLFLCAGIVEQNTKIKDITKLGGLIKVMPITALSFLFCAFSVMGIPPFGGFFSKYLVFAGAIQAGQLWISAVFLIGAFLTIIYLFRVFKLVFLGPMQVQEVREGSSIMLACVSFLAFSSLLGGILISYPSWFAQVATMTLAGAFK